jgi:hypothetical protein
MIRVIICWNNFDTTTTRIRPAINVCYLFTLPETCLNILIKLISLVRIIMVIYRGCNLKVFLFLSVDGQLHEV